MPHDDTAGFIEDFALALNQAGMQRMAARVFAALLVAPEGGATARELSETLGVSAASVSGATSYLTRMQLATRRRLVGERLDRYDVHGTTWAEVMATETQTIEALARILGQGLSAVEPDGAAHERLDSTRDFFLYMAQEMPELVARWRRSRQS